VIASGNLASAYAAAGRHDDALTLFEATLAASDSAFGAEHPVSLHIRHLFGVSYLDAEQPDDAVPHLEAALTGRVHALGPDHPATVATRTRLAQVRQAAARRRAQSPSG